MAEQVRRELERRRFRGESSAESIIDLLNGKEEMEVVYGRNTRSSRKRILDLIDCIRKTLEAIEAGPRWGSMSRSPQNVAMLTGELNRRVAKYPTKPSFYVDHRKEWEFENAIDGVTPRLPPRETLAALGVINLTKERLLDRIRHCICGNWFFARFAHQHWCSAKCRHKNYEQSEEFKANRRAYMRNYYRLKTSGKVK